MTTTATIKVTYTSIDRVRITRNFKTLKGANRFATEYVGEHPEMGSTYAISGDGIGKVTVRGCSLRELFSGSDAKKIAYQGIDWRSPAQRAADEQALARVAAYAEQAGPYRTKGCVCCDEQLYRVGCECPAENPDLPF